MGTNFYLHRQPACECCKRPTDEPLHIGKSSSGWVFSLHVIPEEGINTLDDWRALWAKPGAFIRDEYGETVSIADMELRITARSRDTDWSSPWWGSHYHDEQDFHMRNHSERGPNGLLRAQLGRRCKAHGEGTWDCITGEYS